MKKRICILFVIAALLTACGAGPAAGCAAASAAAACVTPGAQGMVRALTARAVRTYCFKFMDIPILS